MAKFNPSLHPRGPNGRFTRSYARHMSSLDGRKAAKVKSGFKAKMLRSAGEARAYLAGLYGTRKGGGGGPTPAGGGLKDLIASGAFVKANQSLRAGKPSPEADAVGGLMKPLPDGLQLFRQVPRDKLGGASADPTGLKNFKVSDAGYFPTTVAPTPGGPDSVQMRISAPAGTPAAVDPDSGQVVLGDGVEMAVDRVDINPDGSTQMDLVVLPDGDAGGHGSPSAPAARPERTPAPAPEEFVDEGNPEYEARLEEALDGEEARTSVSHSLERRDTLTEDQYRGLSAYISEDYQPINHVLRGGSDADLAANWPDVTRENIDDWVAGVDSAMEQSRLPQEAAVYRGLNATRIFGDAFEQDMTGLEWQEDAYASTSTDARVSRQFAGRGHGATMMNVLVPQGVGAVELSDESYESELLLERGLRFRVVADRGFGDDGTRWLDVEVVPNG